MAGRILLDDGNRLLDSNGNPISGGLVRAYDAGTSTPASLYTTSALSVAHASPVVANSAGFLAQMWADESELLDIKVYAASDLTFTTPLRQFLNVQPVSSTGLRGIAETRDELAAVNGSAMPLVQLIESGREGLFQWTAGNFATRVAADTQQGIYVESDDVAASSGAWVRQTPTPGFWHADWFGIPHDPASGNGGGTEVQCHVEMTAMVNLANIVKPQEIHFGSKIYTLGAELPEWDYQVSLRGSRGAQSTIINKRYDASVSHRGIFAFNNHGFLIDKIAFTARAGVRGAGVSVITTDGTPARGRSYLIDVYVSGNGSGGCYLDYSLYIDGMSNTNVGGPGYRGMFMRGGELFGALVSTVYIAGMQHLLCAGIWWATAGHATTSNTVLDTHGSAAVYNDDWQIQGIVAGDVNLNWFGDGDPDGLQGGRSVFTSPQDGTITVDSHCLSTIWMGIRASGGLTNNSDDGFVHMGDGLVVARGGNATSGWRKWGSGRIQQWTTATITAGVTAAPVSWPLTFTSTAINPNAIRTDDVGANLIALVQLYGVTISQFEAKAAHLNYSTGAVAATTVNIRVEANGT
jgi:hypothetical protein